MKKKKPRWTTPQLIILARGTPEESVLAVCACGAKAPDASQNHYPCYEGCVSCFGPCVS